MAFNVRTYAADALIDWQQGKHYADSLVKRYTRDYSLSHEDRNLLNAIVVGVIRNQSLLDHYISILREGKIDTEVRTVLRVGLYQLLFMGIAEHAAVHETVEGSRKGIRGLVNACLRRALREKEELLAIQETLAPNIRYSHPKWLYQHWLENFTPEQTIALMQWNQAPSKTTFRINPLHPEAAEIIAQSDKALPLTDIEPGNENLPAYFTSNGLPPVEWIENGLIYIQDPATRHAVDLLAPQPGETILDACAAPGGKSTQIAAAMNNQGTLTCTDSNPKRLPRLDENLENQGVTIAEIEIFDWTEPAPLEWLNHFDAILLDVPCSNTGVLRKRVDARWRITPDTFTQLQTLQLNILENAIECLKPGGRLVYSTCSIDDAENTNLIKQFLTKHPEISLQKETQIYPFLHQTDGAYAALLVKE